MMKNKTIGIVTLGVFSIINTEMGVIGILALIAQAYEVSVTTAGLLVSLFAFVVAIAGPTMPLLCSRFPRKPLMIFVLAMFTICNVVSAFSNNFTLTLLMRILPAFFHPVYISMALTMASDSAQPKDAYQATAKVMMGVSAGMVLGVPMVSYLASISSLQMAMLFFAAINAIVLLATVLFLPSIKSTKTLSYGNQLAILKEKQVWVSLLGVIFLNGAIFGVYSFVTNFLTTTTGLSVGMVSIVLFGYGIANLVGNAWAGKKLSDQPIRFMFRILIALVLLYIVQMIVGEMQVLTMIFILIWGVLAGCTGNINQYWISSSAPQAPEFANGLFLSATNLGTTIATSLCGFIIQYLPIPMMYLGGILLLVISLGFLSVHASKFLQKKDACVEIEV